MKKRNSVSKSKKILCILTIIIMTLGAFFNVIPLMKPINVNAAPIPVEEDEVFYQNADFFDYNRWDWNIANYYDAWFYIQVEQPKYSLVLSVDDNNNVYLEDKKEGAKSQMWHFHYNSTYNAFIIENVGNNQVLHQAGSDVGDNVTNEDTISYAQTSISQNWKILSNKDATFRLVTANNSSLVLDVEGSDSSDPQGNSNVHLWIDAGTNNQKWNLIPVSEGTYASALLYKPNPASYTGEADYNNVKQTTGIVKDTLSGSWSSPDFNSPISNNFALFYDSNYSKYSDTGAYNGYADYGGLKPYENPALRKYQMPYLIHNDGWYEFDSSNYYVVKDNSQNKFLLYNRAVSGNVQQVVSDGKFKEGFFPFNGQGVSEANYGIGMRTQLKFTYVDDGYVNYIDWYDENNPIKSQAMEFKFSGDDDLWVFVDGKLVLDVGGIHGRTEGSINFATKKSYVNGVEQTDFSSFFNASIREHILNIFYLERCPYESNLKITFNLLMEHKLTYHSNDGTNKSKEENHINEPQVYIKDNMFDIREGYVFKGWNTKADGSGSSISPNTGLLLQKDINLYAQWEKKEDVVYKITLDGNGGNLDTTASSNKDTTKNHKIYANITNNSYHIYTYDTYIQIHKNNTTESTYKAQREGYEFTGFYTEKTGGRQIISSSGEIIVDANTFTKDTTIYAQWIASDNTKYVVNHWKQKLYYDGTTNYTNPSMHDKVNYNLADTEMFTNGVADSKVTPKRKNYDGFTSPSGMEVTIKSDGSTVVDYYYTRNSYTLTVKPNGSTWNGSMENRSYTLKYEEEMNIPNPSRTGYVFKKWIMTPMDKGSFLTDKNNTSKTFKMGYENTILTVTMGKGDNDESWQPIKYTITYDRNTPAGSLSVTGGETPDSHHVYDVSSKLSENGFTLEGYTFAGWKLYNSGQMYGDNQNKGAVDVLNLTNVDGRVLKMYAQWTPTENIKYIVNHWKQKLYYDGTTDYTDSLVHDEINYSLSDAETLTGITDEQVTPEVNQYKGFSSPSQITVKIKGDGSTVIDYYYTRKEYDVGEDDGNGGLRLICGTGIESTSGAGRYKYGEMVSIDAEVQDGYTWYQWTGTMQAYKKDYIFYMPDYNVTLTANATPDKYKLYFDGNKLEYSLYNDLTLKTTEKEVTFMQALGELPVPTLEGARFDGWYTTRISGGERWIEDTLYPVIGKKVLYARWTDITEPECDIEDSYICPFDGTNISFNCKDKGGSGLKAINLYRGAEVYPENIVEDDTLSVDIVNEEGNCYGILANQFKANPDGDNYYTLEIIDNAGNITTKVFELVCGEPLIWKAKLWRLNKSYAMAGTSDSLVYWTDGSGVYGDMTGFIQTDIEGHVDRIEYEFVDNRIPNIITEINNAHENDTYTDNVQFTLPKERPGYASYVKVKLYRNVGTSHETVDTKNINFRIDKYDFSRIRTRIRVTSGMYIPENEKGHVLPHS